jgi:Sigma 54 modulation/S30EA ribosomal protein C terminus
MKGTQPVQVQIETQGAVPEGMPELAIAKVDSLLRLAAEPVLHARVMLTMAADPAVALPAVARVNVDLDGRLVRAQAAGQTMRESVEHMASRLRARLERSTRNWEARRGSRPADAPGEWRHQSIPAHHPSYFPRPAEERQVIRRRSYAAGRKTPEEALADLNLLNYDFYLFTDELTGHDSVIYRVTHGYRLAQAQLPRPRRPLPPAMTQTSQPAPRLTVSGAIARLEALGHEFLFFVDTDTRRGCLIYHRYDGHYGLIVPADIPQ